MNELAKEDFLPTSEDDKVLDASEQQKLLDQLNHGWEVVDEHHLTKKFEFEDFVTALDFCNMVGELAEEVNHHPEITFSWGYATIEIYTHDVGGLRHADFVWSAKVEAIYQNNY